MNRSAGKNLKLMKYTIFNTPFVNTVIRWGCVLYLKITGWKLEKELPDSSAFVLIAAPHTSNWDLPMMLMAAFVLRVKVHWLGKSSLFRFPFGKIMEWLGGIPVNRKKSENAVDKAVNIFKRNSSFVLAINPEGTRKKVKRWRTGFYHIAAQAQVPVVFGYMDFKRRAGGTGGYFIPTGMIEKEFEKIIKFYRGITGKNPENTSDADSLIRN